MLIFKKKSAHKEPNTLAHALYTGTKSERKRRLSKQNRATDTPSHNEVFFPTLQKEGSRGSRVGSNNNHFIIIVVVVNSSSHNSDRRRIIHSSSNNNSKDVVQARSRYVRPLACVPLALCQTRPHLYRLWCLLPRHSPAMGRS